jgi:hypothetical protein
VIDVQRVLHPRPGDGHGEGEPTSTERFWASRGTRTRRGRMGRVRDRQRDARGDAADPRLRVHAVATGTIALRVPDVAKAKAKLVAAGGRSTSCGTPASAMAPGSATPTATPSSSTTATSRTSRPDALGVCRGLAWASVISSDRSPHSRFGQSSTTVKRVAQGPSSIYCVSAGRSRGEFDRRSFHRPARMGRGLVGGKTGRHRRPGGSE